MDQRGNRGKNVLGCRGIEGAGWFVEDKDARLRGQNGGDGHATRCCWPPDRLSKALRRRSAMPMRSRVSSTRLRITDGEMPSCSMP